jgi:hypothetical protein
MTESHRQVPTKIKKKKKKKLLALEGRKKCLIWLLYRIADSCFGIFNKKLFSDFEFTFYPLSG